ncbi:MAG: peptidylprolyl isomerase [Lachnospiraceae bacterium]|nr:peptidylprolyl isomerase [Lachnospiraceae bacterium]
MSSVLTGCSENATTSTKDTSVSETVENEKDAGEENSSNTDNLTNTTTLVDENITYYADIEIADYGMITVCLDQKSAPITVANFVGLAESGFYDGLTFHRIMEDFMMQGGDPEGNGTGGSENTIVGEFAVNGYDNNLSHTRGAISMARAMDYDSASSQFFIVHEDSTFLDGQYAVFGYVTEGLEVVDAVCESAEPVDDNGTIEAEEQPVITSITIRTEQIENIQSED